MKLEMRFPIRFKIMITLLFVVTIVVSLITFTMANLFHKDKKTYIHDLTSVMAVSTAEKTRSLLQGYITRLRTHALLLTEGSTSEAQVSRINKLFEEFEEFVAVVVYDESGQEQLTLYDNNVLKSAHLIETDILQYYRDHPLPLESLISGQVLVENFTISKELPCLTVSLAQSVPGDNEHLIVTAVLKTDGLMSLMGESKLFDVFLADHHGNLLAHSNRERAAGIQQMDWKAGIGSGGEQLSLGVTREYLVGGEEMIGGFASVQLAGITALVQIPKSAAYVASREFLKNLLFLSVILLAGSAVISFFGARFITRPIEKLSRATRVVAEGNFDVQIDVSSRDEMGELANSFTQMASALKDAQAQLIQSEKLAAFGQLGAGIAHEVKNPLAGILGCAQLALRQVEADTMLEKNLKLIEKETKRCKNIIENLLKFARQEKSEKMMIEIASVVEDAMAILDHQLKLQGVKLKKSIEPGLPQILGNAGQLQQVLINLVINAQQAMGENPGTIVVGVARGRDGKIELRVQDTGPGMPEEIRTKIFEPFFTTKPGGKGTGLGLSVSYGIIQDHQGKIEVQSEVGVGTCFVMTLPVLNEESGKEPQRQAA